MVRSSSVSCPPLSEMVSLRENRFHHSQSQPPTIWSLASSVMSNARLNPEGRGAASGDDGDAGGRGGAGGPVVGAHVARPHVAVRGQAAARARGGGSHPVALPPDALGLGQLSV